MAYQGFAIDQYLDADEVTRQLDALMKAPVYSIKKDALKITSKTISTKAVPNRKR